MKVLWITNIILPEASKLLEETINPYGGWMVNTSQLLGAKNNIKLFVASPRRAFNKLKELKGENINYYLFPWDSEAQKNAGKDIFIEMLDKINPDIIHVFGTEYNHSHLFVNQAITAGYLNKILVSVQGLTSIISQHYFCGLPARVIYSFTIRDIIKRDNVFLQKKKFQRMGKQEIDTIKKIKNIEGRTEWDYACVKNINPKICYYKCPRILRDSFYNNQWNFNNTNKYTLLVTQANYPIKGAHFLIEAFSIIVKEYPESMLYITGHDVLSTDRINTKLKQSSYGKYLRKLIKQFDLENHIKFIGELNEEGICDAFLNFHVFVSSSVIENESNSLLEAMILGVPSVASYVGGIPDTITHGLDGFLYQHDAPYMLAHYVLEIFRNSDLALKLSENAKSKAKSILDPKTNINILMDIYKDIFNEGSNESKVTNEDLKSGYINE